MLRVLPASSADALALVDRRVTRDPGLRRQVRTIVDAVRREGDAALSRYARRFDHLEGDIEIAAPEMRRLAATAPPEVRRALAAVRPEPPARGPRATAPSGADRGGAGRHHRAHRDAARTRGLLRARRAVSAAVVAADDRRDGPDRRRPRHRRGVPARRRGGRGRRHRGRRDSPVPRRAAPTPSPRCVRHRTRAAGRQDRGSRQPLRGGGEGDGGVRLPDRLRSRPDRTGLGHGPAPGPSGSPGTSSRRPSTITDARAFLVTTSLAEADAVRDDGEPGSRPHAAWPRGAGARTARRWSRGSRREVLDIVNRLAPEHLATDDAWLVAQTAARRHDLRRRVGAARGRRLCHRVESRAARRPARRGSAAASRRPISCEWWPCSA